jgi:DNA polymerase III alpha subunit
MFSHLHTHSGFSFLYGTFTPTDLVARAKDAGFAAVALTDKNGLYEGTTNIRAKMHAKEF